MDIYLAVLEENVLEVPDGKGLGIVLIISD